MTEYIYDTSRVETQPEQGFTGEEIIRCRDCKRFHTNTNGFDCSKLEPDGFCAWGERREK